MCEKRRLYRNGAGETAKRAAPVNGQDERFAPLTAAARYAFWIDKAGRHSLCLPASMDCETPFTV